MSDDAIERTTIERARVTTTVARLSDTIARLEADGWKTVKVDPQVDPPGQFLIIAEREAALMPVAQPKMKSKPPDPTTPGGKLRAAREDAGLSQGKVARIAGVTNAYVSDVENNRKGVGWQVVRNLAIAIGVDPATIEPEIRSWSPEEIAAERARMATENEGKGKKPKSEES